MIKEILQSALRLHNEVAAVLQLPEAFRTFQKSMERAMATVEQELEALKTQEQATATAVKANWDQHANDLQVVTDKLTAVQGQLSQALANNGQLSDTQVASFEAVITDLKGLQTSAQQKAADPTSAPVPVVSPGDTTSTSGGSVTTTGGAGDTTVSGGGNAGTTTADSGSASVSGGGDATVQIDQNQA